MPLIKICGTASVEDARFALESGADFVGVIRYPKSPRHAPLLVLQHVPLSKLAIVTVNESDENLENLARSFAPHALQLHGDESPETVAQLSQRISIWKAIHGNEKQLLESARIFTDAGAAAVLVDARETRNGETIYGGTGFQADWNAARALVEAGYKVILAGGLSPHNVARAVEIVRPWMVDVVSGVEAQKGRKDADKVREFLRAARP